jgi:hypothetical protein
MSYQTDIFSLGMTLFEFGNENNNPYAEINDFVEIQKRLKMVLILIILETFFRMTFHVK